MSCFQKSEARPCSGVVLTCSDEELSEYVHRRSGLCQPLLQCAQAPAVEQAEDKPSGWGRSGLRALKVGAAAVTGGALLAVTGARLQGRAQGAADSTASLSTRFFCACLRLFKLFWGRSLYGWQHAVRRMSIDPIALGGKCSKPCKLEAALLMAHPGPDHAQACHAVGFTSGHAAGGLAAPAIAAVAGTVLSSVGTGAAAAGALTGFVGSSAGAALTVAGFGAGGGYAVGGRMARRLGALYPTLDARRPTAELARVYLMHSRSHCQMCAYTTAVQHSERVGIPQVHAWRAQATSKSLGSASWRPRTRPAPARHPLKPLGATARTSPRSCRRCTRCRWPPAARPTRAWRSRSGSPVRVTPAHREESAWGGAAAWVAVQPLHAGVGAVWHSRVEQLAARPAARLAHTWRSQLCQRCAHCLSAPELA